MKAMAMAALLPTQWTTLDVLRKRPQHLSPSKHIRSEGIEYRSLKFHIYLRMINRSSLGSAVLILFLGGEFIWFPR